MDDSELTDNDVSDLLASPVFRRTATDEDYAAAVETRLHIDTAIGITMGKHDCTRHAAVANLQRLASQFNITLLELAKGLSSSSGK
jgi:AmiR/NasT family two-component response regulator